MIQPGPPCLQCCFCYCLPLLINYTLIATWILDSWFVLFGGRQGCPNDRTIFYLAKLCSEVLTLTGWRKRRKKGGTRGRHFSSLYVTWFGTAKLAHCHLYRRGIYSIAPYYCDSAFRTEGQRLNPEPLTPPMCWGNGTILNPSFGPSHILCFPVLWQCGT